MTEKVTHRTKGSIFDDPSFGFPPDHTAKAEIVRKISHLMNDRGLTQTAAAQTMGIAQPDLSNLLRGQFRSHSVERLARMLSSLGGYRVDLVFRDGTEDAHTVHLAP